MTRRLFGLTRTMLLSFDDHNQKLVTIATHGHGRGSIGSETSIAPGEGVLGIAVTQARPIRIGILQRLLRYGRTTRRGHVQAGDACLTSSHSGCRIRRASSRSRSPATGRFSSIRSERNGESWVELPATVSADPGAVRGAREP